MPNQLDVPLKGSLRRIFNLDFRKFHRSSVYITKD